jgi:hypothetical protein
MAAIKLDDSLFVNVDLDLRSRLDLQPLVDAFGDDIIDLWVGRVKRTYEAHLEVVWEPRHNPTSIILRFCKLVKDLPPSKRKLWDAAKSRSFDIGIEAPAKGKFYWSALSSEAIRAAAEVGAQIAITVYGPMKVAKRSRKTSESSSTK